MNSKVKVKKNKPKKQNKKTNSLDESNVLYSDPNSPTVNPFHTRQVSFKLVADVIKNILYTKSDTK